MKFTRLPLQPSDFPAPLGARAHAQRGSATLIALVLLGILVVIMSANSVFLAGLKKELKLVEQRQTANPVVRRIVKPANVNTNGQNQSH